MISLTFKYQKHSFYSYGKGFYRCVQLSSPKASNFAREEVYTLRCLGTRKHRAVMVDGKFGIFQGLRTVEERVQLVRRDGSALSVAFMKRAELKCKNDLLRYDIYGHCCVLRFCVRFEPPSSD